MSTPDSRPQVTTYFSCPELNAKSRGGSGTPQENMAQVLRGIDRGIRAGIFQQASEVRNAGIVSRVEAIPQPRDVSGSPVENWNSGCLSGEQLAFKEPLPPRDIALDVLVWNGGPGCAPKLR